MPKKTPNLGKEEIIVPAEGKAPRENRSASKPRTRTVQVKKEDEASSAPKPQNNATRTSRSKKAIEETPSAKEAASKSGEKTPKETASAPVRKRASTAPKAESEKAPVALPVPLEEKEPEKTEDLPALTVTRNALVTQEEPRGVEIAVPPVTLPEWKKERRYFWGRLLFLLLVGALLALSVLILLYRPTRYSSYAHSIVFLYSEESNTTQILYDGKPCKRVLAGACVRSERDSTGGTCAALVGDTLYLVRGKKVTEIAGSVLDFALSQNGRALVYRTQEQKLYYIRTGRKQEPFAVSKDTRDARYCLSPDGKLLFYTYVEKVNEDEVKTHADVFTLSGDKPHFPHTTNMIPVAIADNYRHIFYFNESGDLYCMNAKGELSLCRSKGEGEMELLFDREFEEVLIKDSAGVALWQENQNNVLSQLKDTQTLTLLANKLAVYRELPAAKQCLVKTLDQNYYVKKGADGEGVELVYLKKGELHKVALVDEEESNVTVTDKGVYYLTREVAVDEERKHLYRCPIGQTEAVRLSFDVDDFLVNSDGSRLLYANLGGMLYTARVVGDALDAVMISGVGESSLLCVSASDAFYYTVDSVLYTSDNGNQPVAVKENTNLVFADAHTAIFLVPEGASEDGNVRYTVYTNHRNRREATQVATGVTGIS